MSLLFILGWFLFFVSNLIVYNNFLPYETYEDLFIGIIFSLLGPIGTFILILVFLLEKSNKKLPWRK